MGQPHSKWRADVQKELVLKNRMHYKYISKNPLLIALIASYKLELLIVFIYNSVWIIIFVVQPFLMAEILEYIQSKSESEKRLDYWLAIVLYSIYLKKFWYDIKGIWIYLLNYWNQWRSGVSGLVCNKILWIFSILIKNYTKKKVNFISTNINKILKHAKLSFPMQQSCLSK